MGGAQWLLEGALVLLLAATLFHAVRLERALGVLKRDRAVLEELVEGFNESTRQAESGIERLRLAADGAGRQMARQIEMSQRLRDDLTFLTERGERIAERLEGAVRSARMFGDTQSFASAVPAAAALHEPVSGYDFQAGEAVSDTMEDAPRLRSQAERDLLRALRAGR